MRRNGWFGSALVDGLVVARGGCAQAAVAEAAAAVAVGAAAVAVRCLSFEAFDQPVTIRNVSIAFTAQA